MICRFVVAVILGYAQSARGIAGDVAFPNIGYLGRGYDIFKGNPDATHASTDPGFVSSVYSFDEYGSERTRDRRYLKPKGVECFAAEVCDINFRSRTIENTKNYYDFLREKISFSGEGSFADIDFSGSFSGSEDFKRIEETTIHSQEIFTISSAKCSKYTANILAFTPPPLDANFYSGMMYSLPVTYDKTKYMKFLSHFGTHVVEGVVMGAKYGELSEMTRIEYDHLVTTNTKIEESAKYSAVIASGSSSSLTETEKREGEKFKKATKSQNIFSFGAKPPTDGSAVTWANRVFDNPMPLTYTLKRIDEVLTDKDIDDNPDLITKRDSLRRALREYCSYLKEKGDVKTCATPTAPPPPPPPPPKTCRLCQSCAESGDYNNQGGRLIHDGDWGPYDMFGQRCQGRYSRSWKESHLCCTGNSPACQLCTSCGADWPFEVGRKDNVGDYGPWVTYGHSCSGSYTGRCDSFALCCKNYDTCRLCTSCGERLTETGRVVHEGDWGQWKMFDAANCIPGARNGYASRPFSGGNPEPKLCCPKNG